MRSGRGFAELSRPTSPRLLRRWGLDTWSGVTECTDVRTSVLRVGCTMPKAALIGNSIPG